MSPRKDVFVIMPFSATRSTTEAEWTEVFEQVFRPSVEACGYACERACPKTGSLIASIVERLREARVVLADITDCNPNVFYELGVRHSLSKRTIVVSQDSSHIPSDLRGYWSLQYGLRPGEVAKFRQEVRRLICEIESSPDKSDSPVSDYLERQNMSVSQHINIENVKKLGALCTELSGNAIVLSSMMDDAMAKTQRNLLLIDCLGLLLQTMYIDVGAELLKNAYELMLVLRSVRLGDSDKALVEDGLNATKSLRVGLSEIRAKLVTGSYSEPPTVSTMEWRSNNGALSPWVRSQRSMNGTCFEIRRRPVCFLVDEAVFPRDYVGKRMPPDGEKNDGEDG